MDTIMAHSHPVVQQPFFVHEKVVGHNRRTSEQQDRKFETGECKSVSSVRCIVFAACGLGLLPVLWSGWGYLARSTAVDRCWDF